MFPAPGWRVPDAVSEFSPETSFLAFPPRQAGTPKHFVLRVLPDFEGKNYRPEVLIAIALSPIFHCFIAHFCFAGSWLWGVDLRWNMLARDTVVCETARLRHSCAPGARNAKSPRKRVFPRTTGRSGFGSRRVGRTGRSLLPTRSGARLARPAQGRFPARRAPGPAR